MHQFCFAQFFFLRLVRRRRRKNNDDEEHKEKITSWFSLLVSFEQICESFVCFFLGGWGKRLEASSLLLLLLLLPSSLLWILFVVLGCLFQYLELELLCSPPKKGGKKKSIVLNSLEFGAEESSDFGSGGGEGEGGRRGELVNLLCFIIFPLLWITLLCFNVWNCVHFVQLLLLSALDFAVASLKIML